MKVVVIFIMGYSVPVRARFSTLLFGVAPAITIGGYYELMGRLLPRACLI
jgi:hypothetical protein